MRTEAKKLIIVTHRLLKRINTDVNKNLNIKFFHKNQLKKCMDIKHLTLFHFMKFKEIQSNHI